jgi:hypothetical protein
MTAKEKAKELFEKYFNIIDNSHPLTDINISAKQCALIAVEFSREFITGSLDESFDKTMYLFEVKQEIEKL